MSEARELRDDDSTEYTAGPLEVRCFETGLSARSLRMAPDSYLDSPGRYLRTLTSFKGAESSMSDALLVGILGMALYYSRASRH